MNEADNRHVSAFRSSKMKPGEEIRGHLEGWIGEMMGKGSNTQHNGQFILTSERACFYRKGFIGEVMETIPLAKITSVETLSRLDRIYEALEQERHGPSNGGASATQPDIVGQLERLAKLRDNGVLTSAEFEAKKADLLARL